MQAVLTCCNAMRHPPAPPETSAGPSSPLPALRLERFQCMRSIATTSPASVCGQLQPPGWAASRKNQCVMSAPACAWQA